jgi:outer membrane lipoprotein-sorting protein
VAVLGAGVLSNSLRASASVTLPQRSPAQLLVDLQKANLTGVSGTVTERADLGLPALPDSIGGDGSASLNSLITGTHTLRVWYSGPDKVRVALIGTLQESDVIRNGTDAWIWNSEAKTANHFSLKENASGDNSGKAAPKTPKVDPSQLPGQLPFAMPTSPEQAAGLVLAALSPTTIVDTEPSAMVAGRPAYLLSVAPRDTNSLIAKIVVAIDGTEHVPLRVEVFAKNHLDSAAFSVGFSQVSFTRPDDQRFSFTPPAGTKVIEGMGTPDNSGSAAPAKPSGTPTKTATVGTGWTTVFAARAPIADLLGGGSPSSSAKPGAIGSGGASVGALLNSLPKVQGSWGSGRLLQSHLFSVLITDDGRILVGPVSGDRLESAAADPAAALK